MTRRRSVLILAGGRGTRLRGLHDGIPKPMIPVAGRPFLDYQIDFWRAQGADDIIVSAGHLAPVIARFLDARPAARLLLEHAPLGTGGAVRHALSLPEISDPFLVANGDSLLIAPLDALWHLTPTDSAAIAALESPDTSRFGALEFDPSARLLAFAEKRSGSGWINAGVYGFRRHAVAAFPEGPSSLETQVFPGLLARGGVIRVVPVRGDFIDIGTPESLLHAESFVSRHFPVARP
jgi:D-glycero-alpha-D-manno-heptose 1-phosphate guanylyltransferase